LKLRTFLSSIALAGSSLLYSGEIEDLKAKLAELEARQNALAEEMDKSSNSLFEKTTLGGYGELHYNNLDGENGASDKDEIDFHRFVLMINHEFSSKVTLYTELELEHALSSSGGPGEIELEQAYLDFKLNDNHAIKAGLFLMPVGILNETHEPDTFYGVERNPVEKNIIPTTWWEAGVGATGQFNDHFGYDVSLHSGFNTSGPNYKVRSGRQKVASADAKDFAYTVRLRYNPIPNLKLSLVGQYQQDVTQSTDPAAGSATLLNANVEYNIGGFGLRALYATWDLDGNATGPEATGADEQEGFYIEPSYKINQYFGVFTRYNNYDNAASQAGNGKEQWDFGVNYWPVEGVVVKADVQLQDNDNDQNQNGFNLGIGYSF
jgi:hypothetical protein